MLVDENELYSEDQPPPETLVNSAAIVMKRPKDKQVWEEFLFPELSSA